MPKDVNTAGLRTMVYFQRITSKEKSFAAVGATKISLQGFPSLRLKSNCPCESDEKQLHSSATWGFLQNHAG